MKIYMIYSICMVYSISLYVYAEPIVQDQQSVTEREEIISAYTHIYSSIGVVGLFAHSTTGYGSIMLGISRVIHPQFQILFVIDNGFLQLDTLQFGFLYSSIGIGLGYNMYKNLYAGALVMIMIHRLMNIDFGLSPYIQWDIAINTRKTLGIHVGVYSNFFITVPLEPHQTLGFGIALRGYFGTYIYL